MLLVVTSLHAMGTRITSGLIGRPLGSYHDPDFATYYLVLKLLSGAYGVLGRMFVLYFPHSGPWKLPKATPLDLYPKPKTKHDLIM